MNYVFHIILTLRSILFQCYKTYIDFNNQSLIRNNLFKICAIRFNGILVSSGDEFGSNQDEEFNKSIINFDVLNEDFSNDAS